MSAPQLLMCPPDHYGIEYEINPWMNRAQPADHELATSQWHALHRIFTDVGANISLLDPVAGLPDLVFTANAGLVDRRRIVLSRFRHPQRQGEEEVDAAWFASAGYEVIRLPNAMAFEGAGDALFFGNTLVAGYLRRSDAKSVQHVGKLIGAQVIPLELVDPYYYHLDTCFCPISEREAIIYPGAFDEYGQRVLRELVPEPIEVDEVEARAFACNAVVLGRTVVTNVGCPQLTAALARKGFETRETPLGEFVKAGGSAKCLTLRLDGEEAAAWKRTATAG